MEGSFDLKKKKKKKDTAAPSEVVMTGVLAQGAEGTAVQITIGAGVMIAVMEQCMIGEAQYMIITTGAEALLSSSVF